MKPYIKLVARVDVTYKNIGWHTFRHPFGRLLKANRGRCEDGSGAFTAREQQDQLDVYTQAVGAISAPHKARL